MIQIKALSLFQENPQNNDQILTLSIYDRQNNFYAPVTPSQRDTKKETQQLSCSTHLKNETGHERTKDKSTSKKNQNKQTMR